MSEQDQGHQDGPFPPEDVTQSGIDDEKGAIGHQICQHDPTGRFELAKLGGDGHQGRCHDGRFQRAKKESAT